MSYLQEMCANEQKSCSLPWCVVKHLHFHFQFFDEKGIPAQTDCYMLPDNDEFVALLWGHVEAVQMVDWYTCTAPLVHQFSVIGKHHGHVDDLNWWNTMSVISFSFEKIWHEHRCGVVCLTATTDNLIMISTNMILGAEIGHHVNFIVCKKFAL